MIIDLSNLFLRWEPKNGGPRVWAIKITPDNAHEVAKRVGGHVLEGPKGVAIPTKSKYLPLVVELWDYLVSNEDGWFTMYLGLSFEDDYRLVSNVPKQPGDDVEWAGDWWNKRPLQRTEAEQMAKKLTDTGFSYEDAKKWVLEVQAEALEKERARIKNILDTVYVEASE